MKYALEVLEDGECARIYFSLPLLGLCPRERYDLFTDRKKYPPLAEEILCIPGVFSLTQLDGYALGVERIDPEWSWTMIAEKIAFAMMYESSRLAQRGAVELIERASREAVFALR